MLRDNQSVGSEVIGSFGLFPFQLSQSIIFLCTPCTEGCLVLALAIVSGAFTPEAARSSATPLVLQIFILINGIIRKPDRPVFNNRNYDFS